jgi:hypothetical protein
MAHLRVGQRVLVTGTVEQYIKSFGYTVPLRVTATYADITGIWGNGDYDCRILHAGSAADDARVRAEDITVVRGKPFVRGHGDSRRGRGPAARTAHTASTTTAPADYSALRAHLLSSEPLSLIHI